MGVKLRSPNKFQQPSRVHKLFGSSLRPIHCKNSTDPKLHKLFRVIERYNFELPALQLGRPASFENTRREYFILKMEGCFWRNPKWYGDAKSRFAHQRRLMTRGRLRTAALGQGRGCGELLFGESNSLLRVSHYNGRCARSIFEVRTLVASLSWIKQMKWSLCLVYLKNASSHLGN